MPFFLGAVAMRVGLSPLGNVTRALHQGSFHRFCGVELVLCWLRCFVLLGSRSRASPGSRNASCGFWCRTMKLKLPRHSASSWLETVGEIEGPVALE